MFLIRYQMSVCVKVFKVISDKTCSDVTNPAAANRLRATPGEERRNSGLSRLEATSEHSAY